MHSGTSTLPHGGHPAYLRQLRMQQIYPILYYSTKKSTYSRECGYYRAKRARKARARDLNECPKLVMEKRILGFIFSLLGAAGLIIAGIQFMNGSGGTRNVKSIVIYAILGAVFFFAGVGLIKSTKDRPS